MYKIDEKSKSSGIVEHAKNVGVFVDERDRVGAGIVARVELRLLL